MVGIQLKLFEMDKENIEKVKEIVKERKEQEQGIYKCDLCGKKGRYGKEIFWICNGALFPNNFYAHTRCYIEKLKEKYNFIEKGYREWNGEIEIFSATTGWEKIKMGDVKYLSDNILGNPVFPYIVVLKENTFGITEECKSYFEGKGIEFKGVMGWKR